MKSLFAFYRSLAVALGLTLTLGTASAAPKGRASKPAKEPGETIHVVAPGHTLGKIAKRYRVSIDDLLEANNRSRRDPLKPGTRLVIPSSSGKKAKVSESSYRDDDDDDDDRDRDEEVASPRDKRATSGKRSTVRNARDDRDDDEDESDDEDDRGSKGKNGKSKGAKGQSAKTKGKNAKGKKGKNAKDDDSGFVHLVHGSESWEGHITDRKGKLTTRALEAFGRILRSSSTGKKHPIEPRLVSLVGMVSDHFEGRTIEVVSGFRPYSSTQYTPKSRHNSGHAIDFHVQGVSNEEVRDFCRTLKNVGCGYYPNNTFVHMDVRETSTYWVDLSRHGEAPRYLKGGSKDVDEDHTHDGASDTDEGATAKAPAVEGDDAKD